MASTEEIAYQQGLLTINRRNLRLYLKQKTILGETYVPPGVVNGIYEAREDIRRIKQTLRSIGVFVEDLPEDRHLEDAGDAVRSTLAASVERQQLFEVLDQRFSDDDLRGLAFALGLDYENLPGQAKSSKARELVLYCERRNNLVRLTDEIRRTRPDIVL